MQTGLATMDRLLSRLPRWKILAIATCGIALIAFLDLITGYEVSVSALYLVPIAIASWYGGRAPSVSMAVLACVSWFSADVAAGHPYDSLAVPVWNAVIRFGFFIVNGLLVVALRDSFFHQLLLARTDALTGVFGRRAFEERLGHDLEFARRNESPLTLAFIDLDNFKALNDTRGHNAGDEALRATAHVLQLATREADTVARLGGDEFALVLPDTSRRGAEEVVTKLMHDLREALGRSTPKLTCSIGVVTFEESAPELGEAVSTADALMYQAKRGGKNRIVFSAAARAKLVGGAGVDNSAA